MVKLEEAVVARFSSQGLDFEILVDPELAMAFREGKKVEIRNLLAVEKIFKDARKGEVASRDSLLKVFGTEEVEKVVGQILLRGKIQLTTEQRRKMREEKLKQIVSLIARRAINPQTGLPHPPSRVEEAVRMAKVGIDEFKTAEEQLPAVLKAIQSILPLKFEMRKIALKIPPSYAGKALHAIRGMAEVKKEEWLSDGSLLLLVELPAGLQPEFFDRVNDLTKGEAQIKVV
ncbi:MAG: ribosome assembly factor SBDS [Hadesarchaea archaeon]|jgi:ribosome maturation protein SDO1|nr:ribosome assembly factor SBDS [Hadesarchaea archaeon]